MSIQLPTRLPKPTPTRVAALTFCLMLGGCSAISQWWGAEKADYHGQSKRTQPLEVPPDLTQLQRDTRYLPQSGVITASDMAHGASAPAAGSPGATASAPETPSVALSRAGDIHLVRQGEQRWLASTEAPEIVWPKVHDFWTAQGFTLKVDDPQTGILETDWKMNPSTLPRDFVHEQLGKVLEGVFDSGLRDRYRTRLERQPDGSTEIFLTQFGASEEIIGFQKSETQWVPRPNDPGLEAQMLSKMMLSLGGVADTNLAAQGPEGAASAATPSAAQPGGEQLAGGTGLNGAARAHVIANQPGATMQVDDNFDRSWRRIGLALDHGGFTVEDRDRAQGLYYVRFVDAKEAAKDEPGIFTKFKGWFGKSAPSPVGKYRLAIKSTGDVSTATVLNDQGQPDNSDNARRMVTLLVDELK